MSDWLEEAASEMISGTNQRISLQALLQVPTINEMYGRIGGADFYRSAISVLKGLREVAEGRGLVSIVQEHTTRLAFAQSMLEKELRRKPIPITASDAEPGMWHDPETGQSYVVFGGGPQEGGYSIELREHGENRMVPG